MVLGRVYGSVVSTHKLESLVGCKIMLVQCIENGELADKFLVAVDGVGAGIGEDVIITQGSSARIGMGNENAPVDALIVGILDKKQV